MEDLQDNDVLSDVTDECVPLGNSESEAEIEIDIAEESESEIISRLKVIQDSNLNKTCDSENLNTQSSMIIKTNQVRAAKIDLNAIKMSNLLNQLILKQIQIQGTLSKMNPFQIASQC